jgi:hypothetical protein
MRSCALSYFTRAVCAVSVTTLLVFGPIGCDSGSGPAAGKGGELPPEIKQSNKNMEDAMKNQPAK